MTRDIDGIRIEIEPKRVVLGPTTIYGALRLTAMLQPYDALTWTAIRDKIEGYFCVSLPGPYRLTNLVLLPADQSVAVVEFKAVEEEFFPNPERVQW